MSTAHPAQYAGYNQVSLLTAAHHHRRVVRVDVEQAAEPEVLRVEEAGAGAGAHRRAIRHAGGQFRGGDAGRHRGMRHRTTAAWCTTGAHRPGRCRGTGRTRSGRSTVSSSIVAALAGHLPALCNREEIEPHAQSHEHPPRPVRPTLPDERLQMKRPICCRKQDQEQHADTQKDRGRETVPEGHGSRYELFIVGFQAALVAPPLRCTRAHQLGSRSSR